MSVAQILEQMGQNAARRQLVRGQVMGNAVGALAQAPGAILQMRDDQRVQDAQRARQQQQDARVEDTYQRRVAGDDREIAAAQAAQGTAQATEQLYAVAFKDGTFNPQRAAAAAEELGLLHLMPLLEKQARENAPPAAKLPEFGTPAHETMLRTQALLTPPPVAPDFVGPQAPPMTPNAAALQAYDDQRAATAKPTTAKAPPEIGSFGDYLGRYATEKGIEPSRLKPADVEAARKKYQQADDRPRVNVSVGGAGGAGDVKESIAGMKDGTLPPLLPGRASKDYTAIMAEAHRQGYDIARAATDWTATQKHVATMNGAQQLRLNQAINALPDMLDSVDSLATQWKGGRFPTLNKASLALAKGGAYGKEAASIANQLDAQIADVTADLGNVYMGGNSPTDHALGLAGKSLKGEWDEKVLHDMVALAKKNVVIRRNSIANTGVAGASATNPYGAQAPPAETHAPPALAPSGTHRVVQNGVTFDVTTDAGGKIVSSKAVR